MNGNIEYLIDSKGHKKSVVIPYKEWQMLEKQRNILENKLRFIEELQNSVNEVKDVLKGKRKAKPMADFLNEI